MTHLLSLYVPTVFSFATRLGCFLIIAKLILAVTAIIHTEPVQ